jgi:hypothetical protein
MASASFSGESDVRVATAAANVLLLSLAGAVSTGHAQTDEALQNWFNDPFLQITADVPMCPLPAGPFVDEASRRAQTHRRAEKGTTCWLAKECDRPNAYAYDQDIAAALQNAVRGRNPFPGTSLWVTVQGRVLYIEGCAVDDSMVAQVESFARALPHVQQAIAAVRTDPRARPPYRTRADAPDKPAAAAQTQR